jgi:hypothetical protein
MATRTPDIGEPLRQICTSAVSLTALHHASTIDGNLALDSLDSVLIIAPAFMVTYRKLHLRTHISHCRGGSLCQPHRASHHPRAGCWTRLDVVEGKRTTIAKMSETAVKNPIVDSLLPSLPRRSAGSRRVRTTNGRHHSQHTQHRHAPPLPPCAIPASVDGEVAVVPCTSAKRIMVPVIHECDPLDGV